MARQSINLLGFTDKTCVAKPTYIKFETLWKGKTNTLQPLWK